MRRSPRPRSPSRGAAYKPDAKWPLKVTTPSPTRTAGPTARGYSYQTSPNEKRDVGADVRRANDAWTVAIYDMAQAVGEKRGAQVSLIYGKLLPKGRKPRIVRRPTRRTSSTTRAWPRSEVRRDVDEAHPACPASPSASTRTAASCSPTASACASWASRRRPTRDTRYMIASNTKAMATLMLAKLVDEKKLAWDTPAVKVAASFKLGERRRHEPGPDQASHLRVHRHAAPGPRVAARVRRASPPRRPWPCWGPCSRPATSASCSSIPIPWPRPPASSAATSRIPPSTRRRVRQGDADAGVRSAGHDVHDLRFRQGPARQRRGGHAPDIDGQPALAESPRQPVHRAGASRGRGLELGERRDEVRRHGARRRQAARRQDATSRGTRCSPGARRRSPSDRRHLRHGPDRQHPVRHARRPSRRRHDRLPQRHDVAARARRRRGHPDQRRPRLAHPHASAASCWRCCSTATRRPTARSRPPQVVLRRAGRRAQAVDRAAAAADAASSLRPTRTRRLPGSS